MLTPRALSSSALSRPPFIRIHRRRDSTLVTTKFPGLAGGRPQHKAMNPSPESRMRVSTTTKQQGQASLINEMGFPVPAFPSPPGGRLLPKGKHPARFLHSRRETALDLEPGTGPCPTSPTSDGKDQDPEAGLGRVPGKRLGSASSALPDHLGGGQRRFQSRLDGRYSAGPL